MDQKTRDAYVSMMIGSIAHNLARYQLGLVTFSTPVQYKASLIIAFSKYGVSSKLYRIWMRKAEVKAKQEMRIIEDNEDLQGVDSNGGTAITAEALVGPYLSFLGYKKQTIKK